MKSILASGLSAVLFLFLMPTSSWAAHPKAFDQCRSLISKITCEVTSPPHQKDRFTDNRDCLKVDTTKYQKIILTAFDAFPEFLQKRFCTLKRVYIEDEFFGAAWSAPVDEKTPHEFLIGLRKAELDKNNDLQTGLTLFQQQSFGGGTKINESLPGYKVLSPEPLSSTAFTLLHELGHTFDYENEYSKPKDSPKFNGSWTSISWNDVQTVKPESDFAERKSICLNNCNGKFIDPKSAGSFYETLFNHGFISQLSALNSFEDFADSFAFFIAQKYWHATFVLNADGKAFDLTNYIQSATFKKKREFLEKRF